MNMKDLLFDVLDKLQPYEHVEAFVGAHYVPLCKPDATLPFILSLSYEEEGYDNVHNYYCTDDNEYERLHEYIQNNQIEMQGKNYLLSKQIVDIHYLDEYIYIEINSVRKKDHYYIPYSSINAIERQSEPLGLVYQANYLTWELNNN